jgi:chromosome segregation ATPase
MNYAQTLRDAVEAVTGSLQQSTSLESSSSQKVNELSNQLHLERLRHDEVVSAKTLEAELLRAQVEELNQKLQKDAGRNGEIEDQLNQTIARERVLNTEIQLLRHQMQSHRANYDRELTLYQTNLSDMSRRKDEAERELQLRAHEVEELKSALRTEKAKNAERGSHASDVALANPTKPKEKSKKHAPKEIRFA